MNHPLTSRAALPSPAREPQPADPAGAAGAGGAGGPDGARPAEREAKLSQADVLLHLGVSPRKPAD
ncbi:MULTISPECIES: hypothetical protein [Streptomyces]|uniref:hypothetical protein n=1 Tax=Streptomyces TaxID=1883 RepID=UPI00240D0AEE|nr:MULTISPECIES: hypothetical protein [Streptomyces]WFB88403.1 hypothetical protein MMU79_36740 [Streptomyces olivaceus]WGK50846.1 hypothetical protein M6G09_37485 [Streptomyces sp. B146]